MHRKRDTLWFIVWFVVLSLALGWVFWQSGSAPVGLSMLAVPVTSAMLAAQGFSWKRKLTYAALTLGLYVLGSVIADVTGFLEFATQEANGAISLSSLWVILYEVYLFTFPLAMLVLFVGRRPSLLWSKDSG
jgi:uncharacterized membrane protein YphA (DoxX/SURF4 family)